MGRVNTAKLSEPPIEALEKRWSKRKAQRPPYRFKIDRLRELEKLSETGLVDLFWGDGSHVCAEGRVPYGWQFPGEKVCAPSEKGHKVNCFGLINRNNQCHWRTPSITSKFVLSANNWSNPPFKSANKRASSLTGRANTPKTIRERMEFWHHRGRFIFFLRRLTPLN